MVVLPIPLAGFVPSIPSSLEPFVFLVIIGVLVVLGLAYQMALVRAAYSGDESDQGSRTNCPECGARTTVEPPECDYCGDPFD